jgi:hypothetical protein
MFAVVVGFILTLIFFGLPLAIMGLFIMSILDQKSRGERNTPQDAPTLKSQGVDKHPLGYSHEIGSTDTPQSPRDRRQRPGAEAPRPADTATAETWGSDS